MIYHSIVLIQAEAIKLKKFTSLLKYVLNLEENAQDRLGRIDYLAVSFS